MTEPDPELIVDSDWKAQVEKEKQQAANDASPATTDANEVAEPDEPSESAEKIDHGPIPPASLQVLLTTLYSQTMMSLGVIPNPSTQEAKKDLPMAKHFIDTIEILQQKTVGNTTDDETKMFEELLHNLRMAYVQMSKEA